jgi:hypothetical protein
MDESTLVCNRAVRADKDVLGDSLTEHLDLEDIRDYLLRLAVDVGVHERDVVVARDNVAERGEAFFDTLKRDSVWEGVAEVLQLLVCRRRRHEEPMAVASGETADDARATDGGVHDGDDLAELRLERGVEVGATLNGDEAVRVCEFGENADIAAVFELETCA